MAMGDAQIPWNLIPIDVPVSTHPWKRYLRKLSRKRKDSPEAPSSPVRILKKKVLPNGLESITVVVMNNKKDSKKPENPSGFKRSGHSYNDEESRLSNDSHQSRTHPVSRSRRSPFRHNVSPEQLCLYKRCDRGPPRSSDMYSRSPERCTYSSDRRSTSSRDPDGRHSWKSSLEEYSSRWGSGSNSSHHSSRRSDTGKDRSSPKSKSETT